MVDVALKIAFGCGHCFQTCITLQFSAGRPVSAHCNKILVLISDSDIQYNDSTIQILERYQDYVSQHLVFFSYQHFLNSCHVVNCILALLQEAL